MSVGIGMEAGEREAELASQTAAQMAEALINLLSSIGRKSSERYSDDYDRGTKVMALHVKLGGLLRQSVIDERDAATFAGVLREVHVPYMQLRVMGEDGAKMIFVTRGGAGSDAKAPLPDDGANLEKAWTLFVKKMMERMQERDVLPETSSQVQHDTEHGTVNGTEREWGQGSGRKPEHRKEERTEQRPDQRTGQRIDQGLDQRPDQGKERRRMHEHEIDFV